MHLVVCSNALNRIKSLIASLFLMGSAAISSCAPSIRASCYPQSIPFGSGSGTASNPYTVCSATHLRNVNQNLNANFLLTQDLDLTNSNLTPIGSYSSNLPFTGTFNGGNHSLSNWTYSNVTTADAVGFFADLSGSAVISNLNLVNFNVSGSSRVGLLAGAIDSNAQNMQISNCSSGGLVTAAVWYAGGLVGASSGPLAVSNSYSTAAVNGVSYTGGLIGSASGVGSTTIRTHATGNVTGSTQGQGGLFGYTVNQSISQSYATGNVYSSAATSGVGGLTGGSSGTTISNSYATGNVSANLGSRVGGLVGYSYGGSTISNSYSTGSVSGGSSVGGLVGLCSACSGTTSSYWNNVTGPSTTSDSGSSGESTAALQTQATYSGWDFVNVWNAPVLGASYPTLR